MKNIEALIKVTPLALRLLVEQKKFSQQATRLLYVGTHILVIVIQDTKKSSSAPDDSSMKTLALFFKDSIERIEKFIHDI